MSYRGMSMMPAPALLTLVLLATGCGGAAEEVEADLVISPVAVVDVVSGVTHAGQSVAILDGEIVGVGPVAQIHPRGDFDRIDGTDLYLVPGLWDMHVHLANRETSALSPERQLELYLEWGVVGVRDMGSDPAQIARLRAATRAGEIRGPRIISPGPFVDGGAGDEGPVFRNVVDEGEARQAVRDLVAAGSDFIKVQARLGRDAYFAVLDEADRAGIDVAGHIPDALGAEEVSNVGQRTIEHVSPALPSDAGLLFGCSRQEEELRAELAAIGAEAQQPDADRVSLLNRQMALQIELVEGCDERSSTELARVLVANGTRVVPTLIWSQTFAPIQARDLPEDLPFEMVPPETLEEWLETRRQYVERVGEDRLAHNRRIAAGAAAFVGRLHAAGVELLAGTDSFDGFVLPGYSLHRELELLVGAGLSPAAALRAATVDAARFRGEGTESGSVAVGLGADLVLVGGDPLVDIRNTRDVRGVILGGVAISSEAHAAEAL